MSLFVAQRWCKRSAEGLESECQHVIECALLTDESAKVDRFPQVVRSFLDAAPVRDKTSYSGIALGKLLHAGPLK